MITRESIIANKEGYLKAIGQATISWTHLVTIIESATWKVSGIDPQLGRAFTNEVGSVSLLITLETLVHTLKGEGSKLESIRSLIARINEVRKKRNDLDHSLWGFSGDTGAYTMKASAKGKNEFKTSYEYQNVADVEMVGKQIIAVTLALEEWIRAWTP
jgi:hypothetical protein